MKYLLPLFLTLACGKTHSTAQKTSNKNPVIKALNLDKLKLYPLELVHLISEENFLQPAKIQSLDQSYKIRCTRMCIITRRIP